MEEVYCKARGYQKIKIKREKNKNLHVDLLYWINLLYSKPKKIILSDLWLIVLSDLKSLKT